MEIIRTEEFERALRKLPSDARKLYEIQERRFRDSWRDPRLHVKKVQGLENALSFRVTRRYRVLFYVRDSSSAIFFEVDHRKDVYR